VGMLVPDEAADADHTLPRLTNHITAFSLAAIGAGPPLVPAADFRPGPASESRSQ
jgi:hypothetical protein